MNVKRKQFIEEFEQTNNVTICPYGKRKISKWLKGRRNAHLNLWTNGLLNKIHKKDSTHIFIHIDMELLEVTSDNALTTIFWHEIGHVRSKQFWSSENTADIYAIKYSGLSAEQFYICKTRVFCFNEYGTFDLNLLPYLEEINKSDRLKLFFGWTDLPDLIEKRGDTLSK